MNLNSLVTQNALMLIDAKQQMGARITEETIREAVLEVVSTPTFAQHDIDVEKVVRDLEASVTVHIGEWNYLSDDSDHQPWLDNSLVTKNAWKYWKRYETLIGTRMPRQSVARLDQISDDILGRLESPERTGAWDRRGLVAGRVQSGKTGNYVGLIAKALDAGYKLVVVLAGAHNSLRSQTQQRIDEGILGFDSQIMRRPDAANRSARIGVGTDLHHPWLPTLTFTSSADDGDFKLDIAQKMGVAPGGSDPIVMVVKKNKAILDNLYEWSTKLKKETNPETGEEKVRNVPVLVIDDEADHYSVNTKGTDEEDSKPSTINGLVRKFLHTFEQTAYVGYTATPFANIFIDNATQQEIFGRDLFPRSFIINLPAPSNYMGPEQVFGLAPDSSNEEGIPPLPITREVSDYVSWLPDKHKAAHRLGNDLPGTLRQAILMFLLGGAVRASRGDGREHQSMLVHVTRFTSVQAQVRDQVAEYLDEITNLLVFGEGENGWLSDTFRDLFVNDVEPTWYDIAESGSGLVDQTGPLPTFEEVQPLLPAFAQKTRIHLINGSSDDVLEYGEHPDGLSVIAIGGDKLARGLTLEGLTVSYFLRASRMYDTLMQMGRWFGYRPSYLDTCRLYTTPVLIDWYQRITAAAAELQNEFAAMAVVGKTPDDFGLRVRQHPDGLMVTAANKLRNAEKLRLTFSGTVSETVTFDASQRADNVAAVEAFLDRLGEPDQETPVPYGHTWRNVAPDDILEFLATFNTVKAAYKANPQVLSEYIRSRMKVDELTMWTVMLADRKDDGAVNRYAVGKLAEVGLTTRVHHLPESSQPGQYRVKRVGSPSHDTMLLRPDTPRWTEALEETVAIWEQSTRADKSSEPPTKPSGLGERRVRDNRHGLLLLYPLDPTEAKNDVVPQGDNVPFIGFVMPFPVSDWTEAVEYQVNPVWIQQEFDFGDDDYE